MYALNKIVGYLISPAGFGMALVAAAVLARVLGRRRLAGWAVLLALANFWIWSTPWMTQRLGAALEAEFLVNGRVPSVESLPEADLIELHGGGMGLATNFSSYAEMWLGADRVWHAARLWREQVKRRKEKGESADVKILVTSDGTDLSTGPLLADLGVPKEAIIYDFGPRNTEEEAKCVERIVEGGGLNTEAQRHRACQPVDLKLGTESPDPSVPSCLCVKNKPKVLVVTSAWHMKRTMLMYQKYAPNVEAVPAPCDFENTMAMEKIPGWSRFLPDPAAFMGNSIAFHEWLGYFGYKWFR